MDVLLKCVNEFPIVSFSASIFAFSANFDDFFRILRQIPEKSDVCRFSINFAKTNRKLPKNVSKF